MNVHRSPMSTGRSTGSAPDLSKMKDSESSQITLRKRKQPDGDFAESLSDFRHELTSTMKEMLNIQNEYIKRLCDDFSEFKNQLSDIKKEQIAQKASISELNKQSCTHDQKLTQLENELIIANTKISELSDQLLAKEQLNRINNLEISGIPSSKGENLHNIVNKLAAKVGFTLNSTDIDHINRVRRYPHKNSTASQFVPIPNIIIKFTQRNRKIEFLAAVRARRGLTTADLGMDGAAGPVFVSDHLAPQNKLLYGRVRQLGREAGYKYIWVNECKIFIRKNDTSKIILISSVEDLKKIQ